MADIRIGAVGRETPTGGTAAVTRTDQEKATTSTRITQNLQSLQAGLSVLKSNDQTTDKIELAKKNMSTAIDNLLGPPPRSESQDNQGYLGEMERDFPEGSPELTNLREVRGQLEQLGKEYTELNKTLRDLTEADLIDKLPGGFIPATEANKAEVRAKLIELGVPELGVQNLEKHEGWEGLRRVLTEKIGEQLKAAITSRGQTPWPTSTTTQQFIDQLYPLLQKELAQRMEKEFNISLNTLIKIPGIQKEELQKLQPLTFSSETLAGIQWKIDIAFNDMKQYMKSIAYKVRTGDEGTFEPIYYRNLMNQTIDSLIGNDGNSGLLGQIVKYNIQTDEVKKAIDTVRDTLRTLRDPNAIATEDLMSLQTQLFGEDGAFNSVLKIPNIDTAFIKKLIPTKWY